jgi:lysozyme
MPKMSPSPANEKGKSSSAADNVIFLKIIAKNFLLVPSMAKDLNIVRQNIAKLVKMRGGAAATGADKDFSKAGELEKKLEEQAVQKGKPEAAKEKTSPELVKEKTKEKTSLFNKSWARLKETKFGTKITKFGTKLADIGSKILEATKSIMKSILNSMKSLFSPKNFMSILGKIAIPLLIITTIWEAIKGAWEAWQETGSIWEAIKGAIGGVVEFFTFGLISKKDVSEFFNGIEDFFKPVVKAVSGFFGKFYDWFAEKFQAIKEFLGFGPPKSKDIEVQDDLDAQKKKYEKEEAAKNKQADEDWEKWQAEEEEIERQEKKRKEKEAKEAAKRKREEEKQAKKAEEKQKREQEAADKQKQSPPSWRWGAEGAGGAAKPTPTSAQPTPPPAPPTPPKPKEQKQSQPAETTQKPPTTPTKEAPAPKVPTPTGDDKWIQDMIKNHEGVRNKPYKDTKGLWTIGVGHLIGNGKSLPPEWDREFTKEEINTLFAKDYEHHKKQAESAPGYDKANEKGRGALIDLAFNMGGAWFKKFPKATKALASGDFKKAAEELTDSEWFRQVKRRAVTITQLIRDGIGGVEAMKTDIPPIRAEAPTQAPTAGAPKGGGSLASVAKLQNSDVDISNFSSEFEKRIIAMATDFKEKTGKKLLITSGFRTNEKQKQLWDAALAKNAGDAVATRRKVAEPMPPLGRGSLHIKGLAIDINSKPGNPSINELAGPRDNPTGWLESFGLIRPIEKEDWHVQPSGSAPTPDNPNNPGAPIAVAGKTGKATDASTGKTESLPSSPNTQGSQIGSSSTSVAAEQRAQQKPTTPIVINTPVTNNQVVKKTEIATAGNPNRRPAPSTAQTLAARAT